MLGVSLLVLGLAGCSVGGEGPGSRAPVAPTTILPLPQAPDSHEPPPDSYEVADPPAVRLLPASGMRVTFSGARSHSTESYLRDGKRLIVAADGQVRTIWLITPDGIWRRDPHADTALSTMPGSDLGAEWLRYLPPNPVDDMAWTQGSGSDTVWFLLQKRTACGADQSGLPIAACWDVTVLNRLVRSTYRFAERRGILLMETEDLRDAASLLREEWPQVHKDNTNWEALRQQADEPPTEPLPMITEVPLSAFHEALRAALRVAGRPYTEMDLDGDGTFERIEGRLDEWNMEPLHLFHSDGRRLTHSFINHFENGWQHRLQIVTIPSISRLTVLYEYGLPDGWHRIVPRWFHGHLVPALGWHPKITDAIGAHVAIATNGDVVITNIPEEMGGFTWTRRYRIDITPAEFPMYHAQLETETVEPGPHPQDHHTLLMAAFVSHWFAQAEALERYIPDPVVRSAFQQEPIGKPKYTPGQPELGKVTYQSRRAGPSAPEIESAPIGGDGTTEFLIRANEYEGYTYYAGIVRFGTASDGRAIILDLQVTKSGFIYDG